jgi:uncharacterized protein YbgA (DUF1722 family)/uncharacterized protein YbbK (DUF523 family)
MMSRFEKPRIVVSRCIEHEKCRYNGLMIASPFVRQLKEFCEMITPCPEFDIGLGVPREAVRLVLENDEIHLKQSMSGMDVTKRMNDFSDSFVKNLPEVDGFLLKSRSPSCGMKDVKIYKQTGKAAPVSSKGIGLFAYAILHHFEDVVIEDEGRLTNIALRENFLTKIFTHAAFRKVKMEKSMKTLVDFHAANKYLMMAYNQTELKQAGKIVANHEKFHIDDVLVKYEASLSKIFSNLPRISTNINVLMHLLGYFSKDLTINEKAFFLDQLEQYRNRKIPLVAVTMIIGAWLSKYQKDYLEKQTYFDPYPYSLLNLSDSGKRHMD